MSGKASRQRAKGVRDTERSGNCPRCGLVGPHFVPPCFGQIGFFACDPPSDLRNHSRCRAPFDHEHAEHFDITQLGQEDA